MTTAHIAVGEHFDRIWSAVTKAIPVDLLRKGNIYVLSSFASQAVMFLAWVFLPWKLPAAEIGQFALVSFGTDLLSKLTLIGMDSALVRFFVTKPRRVEFLRAAGFWLLIGGAVAALSVRLTEGIVPHLISGLASVYPGVMWLMFASAVSTAGATLVFSHHIATSDAASFGRLTLLRSAVLAFGYIAAAWFGFGLRGLLVAQILASSAVVATFSRNLRAAAAWGAVPQAAMAEMAVYGLPMTAYAAFALVSDYTGRLMLGHQASLATLGVYQFFFQITVQVNGLWGSLNRAWTPYVFGLMNEDPRDAFKMVRRVAILFSAIYGVGLIVFLSAGELGLWQHLMPPAYASKLDLFYLLLLGPLFGSIYTAITPPFYFVTNTIRISVTQSLITLATMALSVYLTIKIGTNGAAAGWVIGSFLAPVAYILMFPRAFSALRPVIAVLAIWAGGGALMMLALLWSHSTAMALITLLAAALTVVMFGWLSQDYQTPAPVSV